MPCLNGGVCVNTGDESYFCECPDFVTGEHCEEVPEITNECFEPYHTNCGGVCIELEDGPKCFGNSSVGFFHNNNQDVS